MLAYDYPILGFFWTMLMVFLWIAWIFLLIRIFADIFRNREMSGGGKAFWAIFVIVFPFLGSFVYLLVHGGGMAEREYAQAQSQSDAFDAYVRHAAGGHGTADELSKLAALRDQGVLSDDEFASQKARLLG